MTINFQQQAIDLTTPVICAIPTDEMTNAQRLQEVSNILHAGLLRLKQQGSEPREKALDLVTGESVNGTSLTTEKTHE
jgi:hypothetical protein